MSPFTAHEVASRPDRLVDDHAPTAPGAEDHAEDHPAVGTGAIHRLAEREAVRVAAGEVFDGSRDEIVNLLQENGYLYKV